MKIVGGLLLSFLFVITFGISHGNIPLVDDNTQVLIHANVHNEADEDLDDIRVRAHLYGVDTSDRSRFDIGDNAVASPVVGFDSPEVEADYYPVRVTVRDDDGNNYVKHVWTWLE